MVCIRSQWAYLLVLPVLFLEFLAVGVATSVLPKLTTAYFKEDAILISGLFAGLKGAVAFLITPFFSAASDRVGRKWLLVLSVSGTLAPYVVLLFTDNLWIYNGADLLTGLVSATYPIVLAYMTDCEIPSRARVFGWAHATFGVACVFGPLSGALIYPKAGYQAVFKTTVALTGVAVAYALFILPESLKNKQPWKSLTLKEVNPFSPLKLFWDNRALGRFGIIAFCYFMVVQGILGTILVYLTRTVKFTVTDSGIFLLLYGVGDIICSGFMVRCLVHYLGEWKTMLIGIISTIFSVVLLGLVWNKTSAYCVVVITAFSSLTFPNLGALCSFAVPDQDQGKVQGAIAGLRAFCMGLAPALFSVALRATQKDKIPGLPYLVSTVFGIISLLVALTVPRTVEQMAALRGGEKGKDGDLLLDDQRDPESSKGYGSAGAGNGGENGHDGTNGVIISKVDSFSRTERLSLSFSHKPPALID